MAVVKMKRIGIIGSDLKRVYIKKHRCVFFINYQNKAIKKAVREQNKLTVYGI
jgi:hypothetical protein